MFYFGFSDQCLKFYMYIISVPLSEFNTGQLINEVTAIDVFVNRSNMCH